MVTVCMAYPATGTGGGIHTGRRPYARWQLAHLVIGRGGLSIRTMRDALLTATLPLCVGDLSGAVHNPVPHWLPV